MSFTQENLININPKQVQVYVSSGDRCDGCDKHCQLGYRFGGFAGYIYPTINKEIICRYFDKNNNIQYSGIAFNVRIVELQKIYAKDLAGEIARLCDHYKIRTKMPKKTITENRTFKINPNTARQIRDAHILSDLVQVQLYEGTCGFGRDLGEPITMACALKLMKRIYAVPRPQKICLDANDCPFFAKLIYAYPTRFNDKAVAQLRLGTHFGYISPSCDIRSNYPLDECINKIRLGECRDEFIRQTVGVTMFPELYATKSQKQK